MWCGTLLSVTSEFTRPLQGDRGYKSLSCKIPEMGMGESMRSATQILTWVHLIVECNPKCEDSGNSVPEHFAAPQKKDRNGNNAKLPTANV